MGINYCNLIIAHSTELKYQWIDSRHEKLSLFLYSSILSKRRNTNRSFLHPGSKMNTSACFQAFPPKHQGPYSAGIRQIISRAINSNGATFLWQVGAVLERGAVSLSFERNCGAQAWRPFAWILRWCPDPCRPPSWILSFRVVSTF